ncbi:PREDICTED: disintegrin and metalloproteinase domain-containing protein 11 [Corvus brachyrhynchos]|uniref:disintegrin and metalloproteinase domain-containing protein 11 n=1 Tax=Corvus brachyrhynchos TaxID=85066 RepID=UPI0008167065|nr:PREDICTED: disintegrin and metalloproteinase domain-containing protein 11 [Corvus brachyrhynchos]
MSPVCPFQDMPLYLRPPELPHPDVFSCWSPPSPGHPSQPVLAECPLLGTPAHLDVPQLSTLGQPLYPPSMFPSRTWVSPSGCSATLGSTPSVFTNSVPSCSHLPVPPRPHPSTSPCPQGPCVSIPSPPQPPEPPALPGWPRPCPLPAGPAAQAGALPRRLPRATWQEGRVVSQITHPSRLVGQSSGGEVPKHQLDTRVRNEPGGGGGGGGPGLHLAQVSFMVRAFGSAFTLDLRLNQDRHGDTGTWQSSPPRTAVTHLSPWQGLRPHIVQRVPSCPRLGCLFPALSQRVPGGTPKLRRRRQVRRAQHTVHSETKYIELAVVNDHQPFLQLRKSVVLTSNFAKSVVNLADMIYKEQLNTRIVLVAMETWAAEDRIRMGQDSLETLNEFVKYRREGLAEHSDPVHLFAGRTFQSSRSGTAFVGGICSPARAGGVNEYGNVAAMAVTLAQTLGQNVGMMWNKHRTAAGTRLPRGRGDSGDAPRCHQAGGGPVSPPATVKVLVLNPQSRKSLVLGSSLGVLPFPRDVMPFSGDPWQQLSCVCMMSPPRSRQLLDPPECGNGFVEAGEECDCGSLAECARSGGNCCKKCTLTHDAMCSDGLCCKGCKYEPRGVSCREAVNECDIPETCTGDSSQCPPNLHKLDGYFCENEQGRCYGGRCKTRDRQCNALWGRSECWPGVGERRGCPLLPVPSVTGPSGTNIIIGSIAGAVLVAAIVLGGTGWGFK